MEGNGEKTLWRVVGRTESYGGFKVYLQREVPVYDATGVAEINVGRAMFDRLQLGQGVWLSLELRERP